MLANDFEIIKWDAPDKINYNLDEIVNKAEITKILDNELNNRSQD